jgi:hypothetical protein
LRISSMIHGSSILFAFALGSLSVQPLSQPCALPARSLQGLTTPALTALVTGRSLFNYTTSARTGCHARDGRIAVSSPPIHEEVDTVGLFGQSDVAQKMRRARKKWRVGPADPGSW